MLLNYMKDISLFLILNLIHESVIMFFIILCCGLEEGTHEAAILDHAIFAVICPCFLNNIAIIDGKKKFYCLIYQDK
jgi:hypothetical protein